MRRVFANNRRFDTTYELKLTIISEWNSLDISLLKKLCDEKEIGVSLRVNLKILIMNIPAPAPQTKKAALAWALLPVLRAGSKCYS